MGAAAAVLLGRARPPLVGSAALEAAAKMAAALSLGSGEGTRPGAGWRRAGGRGGEGGREGARARSPLRGSASLQAEPAVRACGDAPRRMGPGAAQSHPRGHAGRAPCPRPPQSIHSSSFPQRLWMLHLEAPPRLLATRASVLEPKDLPFHPLGLQISGPRNSSTRSLGPSGVSSKHLAVTSSAKRR